MASVSLHLSSNIGNEQYKFSSTTSIGCNCCGHTIETVSEGAKAIAESIGRACQHIFDAGAAAIDDIPTFSSVLRKLDRQVLDLVEQIREIPGYFDKFRKAVGPTVGCLDFLQSAADIDYFVNGKFASDDKWTIKSKIAFLIADLGETISWLGEASVLNLSKAAKSIGDVRLFGFVPKVVDSLPVVRNFSSLQTFAKTVGDLKVFGVVTKVSLGTVIGSALVIAYTLAAAAAAIKLVNTDSAIRKTHAALELSNYISEIALNSLMLVGFASVVGMGIVGAAGIITAVAAIVYKINHKEELK